MMVTNGTLGRWRQIPPKSEDGLGELGPTRLFRNNCQLPDSYVGVLPKSD